MMQHNDQVLVLKTFLIQFWFIYWHFSVNILFSTDPHFSLKQNMLKPFRIHHQCSAVVALRSQLCWTQTSGRMSERSHLHDFPLRCRLNEPSSPDALMSPVMTTGHWVLQAKKKDDHCSYGQYCWNVSQILCLHLFLIRLKDLSIFTCLFSSITAILKITLCFIISNKKCHLLSLDPFDLGKPNFPRHL